VYNHAEEAVVVVGAKIAYEHAVEEIVMRFYPS